MCVVDISGIVDHHFFKLSFIVHLIVFCLTLTSVYVLVYESKYFRYMSFDVVNLLSGCSVLITVKLRSTISIVYTNNMATMKK